MSPSILLLEKIHPAAEAVLAESGLDIRREDGAFAGDDLLAALDGVSVLGIRSKSHVAAPVLAAASDLLAIGCFCIGTNQVELSAAGRAGVPVFNAPFSNTRSVAELTLSEVIALHRRLAEKSMAMHAGRWDKSAVHAHEVRGRTLGIIGYGHIGSQVSVLAEALGMRVVYHDVAARLPLGNALPLASLEAVLETADVVSLHVPATELTHHLIGPDQLAAMRGGAFLINNARGSVVDLPALADALRAGHISGAAIDVYPEEPASSAGAFACELAGLPNVILTPHIGGSTEEAQENIAREVGHKIVRYLRSGSTDTAVNVPRVEMAAPRPDQHRILHYHHNVPGVLSKINGMLAELGVNINAEHLESNAEISYVILDVDAVHGEKVRAGLHTIAETIRVRTLW